MLDFGGSLRGHSTLYGTCTCLSEASSGSSVSISTRGTLLRIYAKYCTRVGRIKSSGNLNRDLTTNICILTWQ